MELEKSIDLQKVLEERILECRVEFTLQEVLVIAKKELHNTIIDLWKRKQLFMESENEKPIELKAAHIDEMVGEEEYAANHYMQPH